MCMIDKMKFATKNDVLATKNDIFATKYLKKIRNWSMLGIAERRNLCIIQRLLKL
jgi:hypothetical protein